MNPTLGDISCKIVADMACMEDAGEEVTGVENGIGWILFFHFFAAVAAGCSAIMCKSR